MAAYGRLSIVVAFVFTSISTLVVALRFYSRHFLVGRLTGSDWVMLLALISVWISVVVNWYVIHFSDCNHAHNREAVASVTIGALLSLWIHRISYILDLCLIKTSILLFYSYIASSHKNFTYIFRGLLAIILVGSGSMIIASIFACYPVSDVWSLKVFENELKGIHAKQCYNPIPFWLVNAAYNLITDILLWTLPIGFFLNPSTMPLRRRLELVGVFSVGIMAIIASAIRLRVIVLWLSDFHDQGKNTASLMIWSQIEQNTGIIAGSIPFLRPLFRKALLKARSREQPSPGPIACLIGDVTPRMMPRTPVIPSPTSTFDERKEFTLPKNELQPIELERIQCSWGSAIWDGSQVRQVLPT